MDRFRTRLAALLCSGLPALALTALALIGLALIGLALPGAAMAQHVVRWGNNAEVTTMDPQGAYLVVNSSLLGNVYETLVRLNRDMTFEPSLATSWEVVAPDHYRFTIRQGVRFHDGAPLTPADVVASIKRAASPDSPYASVTHMIRDVAPYGDNQVDVLLRGPYPVLINDIAGISILSKPWMEAHDALLPNDPTKGKESYTSQHTNGTGPYRLVSRKPDDETVLEANPGWWDKRGNDIDRIVFRPIPNDATRVAGLLSGALDLVSPLPVQDVARAGQDERVKLEKVQGVQMVLLAFNMLPDHVTAAGPGPNPLAKLEVRKALAEAVDVAGLTRSAMRGLTMPSRTLLAPEVGGYNPAQGEPALPFDPEGAKRLLAEAGYKDGFTIGFDCPQDRFVNGEQVCQALAAMWARIGVKVELHMMRYAAYLGVIGRQASDIYELGWANTPQLDGFSLLNNVLHTKTAREGSFNNGGAGDPEFDALVGRVATEMDPGARQRLIDQALRHERERVWTMPLYREPTVLGMAKGFTIPASPDGRMRFWLADFK